MKIYLVVRWGNPHSFDKEGEDTIYLIRAATHEVAAQVADAALENIAITFDPVVRQCEPFCHAITELGRDTSEEAEPSIIHGPWIRYAYIHAQGCPTWSRDRLESPWQLLEFER